MAQYTIFVFAPRHQFSIRCYPRRQRFLSVDIHEVTVFDRLRQTTIRLWAESQFSIATEAPGPDLTLGLLVVEDGRGKEKGWEEGCGGEIGFAEHIDIY